jgi:hypothetical protein
MQNRLRFFALILLSTGFTGCALFSSPKRSTRYRIPTTPQAQIPGTTNDNWRYLGTTADGQLIIEINESSITGTSTLQVYSFNERKTIVDPRTFSYGVNMPRYKYMLSNWQMNCSTLQYIIIAATVYDQYGKKLQGYDYSHDNSVRWLQFGTGSIAQMEYNFICLGQNRNLGY